MGGKIIIQIKYFIFCALKSF